MNEIDFLLTNSNPPREMKDVLRTISRRSYQDIERAWDYLDDHAPGEFLELITKLVEQGRSGPYIYRHAIRAVKQPDPRLCELLALAIERAVRKAGQ